MNSDISEKTEQVSIWRRFWKDRTIRTVVLALLLIIGMGLLRPDRTAGMYPREYWAKKIAWRHCADMVLTGDSRVLMALSPVVMQEKFPNKRIRNYAFGGNWYSVEYLEAVERVLIPDTQEKIIVMGITPNSLSEKADEEGNFIELSDLSKKDIYFDIHFAPLVYFFEPMSFRDAAQGMFPNLAETHTVKDYKVNGWVGVHKTPAEGRNELKRYRKIYEKRKVSDKTIGIVMDYVTKWTHSGIRIYGFIAPSCRDMVALEEEMSGFNEAEFVDAFRATGGVWIDIDPGCYESFDGSHLQDHAALKFSGDLALRIYEIEQIKETVSNN